MRVLLVKTSSMGDVVQTLPVVNDILAHHPGAQIEWLVEENYADLLSMHAGLSRIIPVALRRWRRRPFSRILREEWDSFRRSIRRERYDAIVDLQGLLKSALLARLARGVRFGWKGQACREPLAALFYNRRLAGPRFDTVASVRRYRNLCGWALGYQPLGAPSYGLQAERTRPDWLRGTGDYVVFLTATARREKLWPESSWVELGNVLVRQGLSLVFAWGTVEELDRVHRIAKKICQPSCIKETLGRSEVFLTSAGGGSASPPWGAQDPCQPSLVPAPGLLTLVNWSGVFANARAVVGVDTGLTFLAVASGAPTVAIYTATSPSHVGIESSGPYRNVGRAGYIPELGEVVDAAQSMLLANSSAGQPDPLGLSST